MNSDDLEFMIAQYADGSLPLAERVAVEQIVRTDASAARVYEEYRRLELAMKALPKPTVDWDKLSASISSAVEAADEKTAPGSYPIGTWFRSAMLPLALAASVMIVASLGVSVYRSRQTPTGWKSTDVAVTNPLPSASATSVSLVTDHVTGPVLEEVAIGPGTPEGGMPVAVKYELNAPAATSHIAVASGVVSVQNKLPTSSFDMQ